MLRVGGIHERVRLERLKARQTAGGSVDISALFPGSTPACLVLHCKVPVSVGRDPGG